LCEQVPLTGPKGFQNGVKRDSKEKTWSRGSRWTNKTAKAKRIKQRKDGQGRNRTLSLKVGAR